MSFFGNLRRDWPAITASIGPKDLFHRWLPHLPGKRFRSCDQTFYLLEECARRRQPITFLNRERIGSLIRLSPDFDLRDRCLATFPIHRVQIRPGMSYWSRTGIKGSTTLGPDFVYGGLSVRVRDTTSTQLDLVPSHLTAAAPQCHSADHLTVAALRLRRVEACPPATGARFDPLGVN
jgi:hypothetical protein